MTSFNTLEKLTIPQLKKIAKKYDIQLSGLNKTDIIREIMYQNREMNLKWETI
jgi:hypothetical protein